MMLAIHPLLAINRIKIRIGHTFQPWKWSDAGRRFAISLLLTFIALGIVLFLMKRPKKEHTTWAGSMLGAVGLFIVMLLIYGSVPHEFLTWSTSVLQWDKDHYVWKTRPIKFTKEAILRDTIVSVMYVVFLGAQLALTVMWQKRGQPKKKPEVVDVGPRPAGISMFGRPLTRRARASKA